jgi:hypothetical protein
LVGHESLVEVFNVTSAHANAFTAVDVGITSRGVGYAQVVIHANNGPAHAVGCEPTRVYNTSANRDREPEQHHRDIEGQVRCKCKVCTGVCK